MRKTKIICTMGPTTDDPQVLRQLMLAGMNVARINMSHQNQEVQLGRINQIKQIRQELGLPIAILIDTKGPEIRLGQMNGKVELKAGDTFTLTTEDIIGDNSRASVTFKELPQDVKAGTQILIDDGLIGLEVATTDEQLAYQIDLIVAKLQRKRRNVSQKALEQFIHLTGGKDLSAFAEHLNSSTIKEATAELLGHREAFSVLDKTKIRTNFSLNIPHWYSSLQRCMASLKEVTISNNGCSAAN